MVIFSWSFFQFSVYDTFQNISQFSHWSFIFVIAYHLVMCHAWNLLRRSYIVRYDWGGRFFFRSRRLFLTVVVQWSSKSNRTHTGRRIRGFAPFRNVLTHNNAMESPGIRTRLYDSWILVAIHYSTVLYIWDLKACMLCEVGWV